MFIKLINRYLLLTIIFFFSSCINDEYNPNLLKPKTKNNYGEVLFGLEKKYWKSDLGKQIKNSFEKMIKTTPLPFEKEYEIDFVVPNKILKNIKNNNCFVFIDIDKYHSNNTTPIIKKNLWSRNQIIIELKFKSSELAQEYFQKNANELKSIIKDFNLKKIAERWSFQNNITDELSGKISLKFKASKKITLNKKNKNFWWWSQLEIQKDQNGPHEIQKGIIIYQSPYINKDQFQKNNILNCRDSIGEKFLLGKKNNSYMITSKNSINEITDSSFYINNKYVKMVNGCWRMQNDKMGGPFVSYSWLNHNKTKIITAEGYVYAPNFKKLKYLRELESTIVSGI
tara:strand:- start:4155 stop:5177 length:1023 start_codon:yes stop_codon:yes gene_type:complete